MLHTLGSPRIRGFRSLGVLYAWVFGFRESGGLWFSESQVFGLL